MDPIDLQQVVDAMGLIPGVEAVFGKLGFYRMNKPEYFKALTCSEWFEVLKYRCNLYEANRDKRRNPCSFAHEPLHPPGANDQIGSIACHAIVETATVQDMKNIVAYINSNWWIQTKDYRERRDSGKSHIPENLESWMLWEAENFFLDSVGPIATNQDNHKTAIPVPTISNPPPTPKTTIDIGIPNYIPAPDPKILDLFGETGLAMLDMFNRDMAGHTERIRQMLKSFQVTNIVQTPPTFPRKKTP